MGPGCAATAGPRLLLQAMGLESRVPRWPGQGRVPAGPGRAGSPVMQARARPGPPSAPTMHAGPQREGGPGPCRRRFTSGSPRSSACGRGRSRPPPSCSTAGPPCRSSPATARKRPGCSTTRSSARSRTGCATCTSWRSGARRSSSRSAPTASSTTRSRRRSWRPIRRRGSRTSTCPTGPSAAPGRRSPGRPGSSRSPTGSWPIRPATRRRPPPPSSTLPRAWPTPRPRSRARAPSWPSASPRTPTSSASCASGCGRAGVSSRACATANRRPARSSPTTSTSPSRSPGCPRTGSWPCSAGRAKRSSTSPLRRRRRRGRGADRWLMDTVRWAWRTRILVRLGIDVRARLWQAAEDEAVRVFAANLRDLLLAAPAGTRATMGLDPGYRTGVKVAVVDATGKVVATGTVYPHQPQRRWDEAVAVLGRLACSHGVELIAIGNGTASRETDKLAGEVIELHPRLGLTRVVVSEAGASVYSASAYASQELPGLDVSLRGAVSIARRLQDPLAELVKIDPKSIGVGQYQHDLSESKLSRSLDAVVEDCVNAVGVDVNTASAPLLTRVSGIGAGLAENIVAHRDENGPFKTRSGLKEVARLGPKAFEQCAGFLRIPDGDDPLDSSSVHPEAYPVVRRILEATTGDITALIGNRAVLRALEPKAFVGGAFGLPTVTDILKELEKPGRDPRPAF